MNHHVICCLWLMLGMLGSQPLAAQQKKTAIYGDFLAFKAESGWLPAGRLSIERKFRLPRRGLVSAWGIRTGIALWPEQLLTLPVSVMAKTGRWYHHAEAQAGVHLIFSKSVNGYVPPVFPVPLLQIGYRYEPPRGGLILKAFVGAEFFITVTAGIGVGWAF